MIKTVTHRNGTGRISTHQNVTGRISTRQNVTDRIVADYNYLEFYKNCKIFILEFKFIYFVKAN